MSGPARHMTLDEAIASYWDRRPVASRRTVIEARRRRLRQVTPVEVWLRRGAS